jgi:hypothetical protein
MEVESIIREPSSRCYGGGQVDDVGAPRVSVAAQGGVDDARAPQAIAVAEVGSMMLEPLESLLWRR